MSLDTPKIPLSAPPPYGANLVLLPDISPHLHPFVRPPWTSTHPHFLRRDSMSPQPLSSRTLPGSPFLLWVPLDHPYGSTHGGVVETRRGSEQSLLHHSPNRDLVAPSLGRGTEWSSRPWKTGVLGGGGSKPRVTVSLRDTPTSKMPVKIEIVDTECSRSQFTSGGDVYSFDSGVLHPVDWALVSTPKVLVPTVSYSDNRGG